MRKTAHHNHGAQLWTAERSENHRLHELAQRSRPGSRVFVKLRPTARANGIDRWFDRTARRQNHTVSLFASLLTGTIFAYFRYRLRYALLLDTARFLVHAVEFLILLASLGRLAAFTVVILRVGSLIVSGGWWGLLEIMRERLRAFSQSGERDAAEREIGSWVVLSMIAASALTIVGGIALAVQLPSGHDPVGLFYAFLIIVETAVRLTVRVLHSGIYATRRIYRPFWSLLAPTVVQLVVLSTGFYWYPTAAIIIAIVTSNAIGIWITVHYTLRIYRLMGLWPKSGAAREGFRALPRIPPWLALKTTTAGLGLRLDALVVLTVLGIYRTDARALDLTAGVPAWRHVDTVQFFYLILPLFRGAYEGTGLFYFDFARLRHIPALRDFQLAFFRKLLLTTPFISLYFWSLAAAVGLIVLHDIPVSFVVALLPLFVIRSVVGIYQIRLFAEGYFGTLIATVALWAALLGLVWLDPHPVSDFLEVMAAMVTVLVVLLNLQHLRDRRAPPLPTLLALGDWMRELGHEPGPLLVGKITIPEWIPAKQRSAAVKLMQETFDGRGYCAFRSPTTLFYYQRNPYGDSESHPHLALQAATGGAANRGKSLQAPIIGGRDALNRLRVDEWIPTLDQTVPDSPQSLTLKFRTLFTDGIAFDLETLEGTQDMRRLETGLLARALPAAVNCLEDGVSVVALSGHFLTPVFHRGKLRLLFVLPHDPEAALFESWLQIVKDWHLRRANADTAGCRDS